MRFLNLNTAVVVIAFSLGVFAVWMFGGFDYLSSVANRKSAEPDMSLSVTEAPAEPIVTDGEVSQDEKYPFKDYPAAEVYEGKYAKLRLSTEEKRVQGEKLQYTLENQKVDFAGHYIMANWSCGMWCNWSAIIDAKTGKVSGWGGILSPCFPDLDKDFPCDENFDNVEYRVDSKLVVFFGHLFKNDRDEKGVRGFHHFVVEEGRFNHLKSVPVIEQRSTSEIQLESNPVQPEDQNDLKPR